MSEEQNIQEDKFEKIPVETGMKNNIAGEHFPEDSHAPQQQIPNTESPTTMEVHHHPQLEHKHKPWKEYFLEFLMIFLAVTLGFFAENLRENIKDKRQAHEYVESMVNDLQSDLNNYQSSIAFNLLHCRTIDTLFTLLTQSKSDNTHLYLLARKLTMGSSVISPTTKTFEQMKSSGGLRLLSKQFIADSIGSYYQWSHRFDYWSDFQKERLNQVILVNDRIFDATVFFSALKSIAKDDTTGITVPKNNPSLITTDQSAINIVLMRYQYYYGFLKLMNERVTGAAEQASRLITLLKKEYHLE